MAIETIKVPDIGGSENVDVIEINIAVGDTVSEDDPLIVLETDKASMDVPSPMAGKITALKVKEGDQVSEGDAIAEVETEGGADTETAPAAEPEQKAEAAPEKSEAPSSGGAGESMDIPVPDIGGSEGVEVIEISVSPGDEVAEGDSLVVLETDKASMEIPSPAAGTIESIALKEGDKVSEGDVIGKMTTSGGAAAQPEPAAEPASQAEAKPEKAEPTPEPAKAEPAPATATAAGSEVMNGPDVYAGPAVRRLGRQLGVDLKKVSGTGPRGRVTKDDVRSYVKNIVTAQQTGAAPAGGGGIPPVPEVDFAQFGEIEMVKMSKIKKLTAEGMTRSWLNVPRITQFDDADITEMEDFRKGLKAEAEKRGTKLTPLPFLLKACASALQVEPSFNVSMHPDGEHIVQKKYIHIGVAVDTPKGLVVPVIRDVDQKGLWELTEEVNAMAKKARDGKLKSNEMQGACFTISSLGAMGGTGFTPMVSAPEVGILGVSKAQIKPVWNGKEFVPRNMLPLSLSYDHRAVNGADAGRFMTYLVAAIGDIRRLLL